MITVVDSRDGEPHSVTVTTEFGVLYRFVRDDHVDQMLAQTRGAVEAEVWAEVLRVDKMISRAS